MIADPTTEQRVPADDSASPPSLVRASTKEPRAPAALVAHSPAEPSYGRRIPAAHQPLHSAARPILVAAITKA
jgi:hypothetical protein